jgi:hypothetical protein
LLARVDVTAALDIMPQNCFGGLARRRTLRWPTWPTGRSVGILAIEIRPEKDRSQESSFPDAVRTAGWWFQQAAQRLALPVTAARMLYVEVSWTAHAMPSRSCNAAALMS